MEYVEGIWREGMLIRNEKEEKKRVVIVERRLERINRELFVYVCE